MATQSNIETIEERMARRREETRRKSSKLYAQPVHIWNHESWKERTIDYIDTVRAEYQIDTNQYIDYVVRKGGIYNAE